MEIEDAITYCVPGMHCAHCKMVLEHELAVVSGVRLVEVDLASKLVTVLGSELSDKALRVAITEAGYEVA